MTRLKAAGVAIAAVAATTAALLPTGSATATPAVSSTITVVAEGLDTPRGVTYDPIFRRVLVAEAGDVDDNQGACAPGNGGVIYCFGNSGAIFQYSELGFPSRRVVTGLPSIRVEDNSAVLGLHDLDLFLGRINVVFGLSGNLVFRDGLGAGAEGLGQTGYINWRGRLVPTGDLAEFEVVNNPDTKRVDSDPYGIQMTLGGAIAADAAGNDILRVKHDGTVELIANLPPREVMGDPDYESVPTSVVRGPDGAFYIGELTGYPTHPGTARVLRFVPGQAATVYAEGFTSIIDIAFDERGRLIVLEIDKDGVYQETAQGIGRLVRVERDGTQTVLAQEGLENPGGVAVAGHGVFYVTNRTTSVGDTGQLLKIKVSG